MTIEMEMKIWSLKHCRWRRLHEWCAEVFVKDGNLNPAVLQPSAECRKMTDLEWVFNQILFQIKTWVSDLTWLLKDVLSHTTHVIGSLHNCLWDIGSRSHWNWAGHRILWLTANLWNMAITHLSVKAVEACKRWEQHVCASWMMRNIFFNKVPFCKWHVSVSGGFGFSPKEFGIL